MEYFLMRKDDLITLCDFTADGQMISYSENFRNFEIAPLGMRASDGYLKKWWQQRSVPISQGRVEEMLREKGLVAPEEYLLKNLGLSLSDYYWIKPVNSSLKWKDVNLFENDFRENILEPFAESVEKEAASLSPNSSLKGELEKSWVIKNGKRMLIKGSHADSSLESLNEVFASKLHEAFSYDNYTKYELVKIKGKLYDFGCSCEAFTNLSLEFVSAYSIITSEKRPKEKSVYDHFLDVCQKHGIDRDLLRQDLEYQILTDYLLTNVDRHMENIGVLRDADSLKFVRMAPIFDTGRAFNARYITPQTEQELEKLEINSFENSEKRLLAYVSDFNLVDIEMIPSKEDIYAFYCKDSKLKQWQIDAIASLYELKKKKLTRLQEMKGQ